MKRTLRHGGQRLLLEVRGTVVLVPAVQRAYQQRTYFLHALDGDRVGAWLQTVTGAARARQAADAIAGQDS